jgi:ferrochelatase
VGLPPVAVATMPSGASDGGFASAAASSKATVSADVTGILLLNLGGPETLEDVEEFLFNLFSDPEIITLPTFLEWANKPLAWVIARSRAPQSREGYAESFDRWRDFPGSDAIREVRSGAPQLATTQAQGAAIEAALAARGVESKAYIAMRYWSPYTSDALAAIKADGISRLVVLPLYPQFSISTSGSSLRALEREFYADEALREGVRTVVIPAWYNREGYIDALTKLIAAKCDAISGGDRSKEGVDAPHVFFSAHGLPKKYISGLGDPYQKQTEATVSFVMSRLRLLGYRNDHSLAYQSKVGPIEWLEPATDQTIRDLAASGVKSLVVVPISFVSEHIETLEEIDMEYRELAEEAGITNWERVPALSLEPSFIEDLADAVVEVLPKINEPPNSAINEGRPVSLRVVNDLVQLRAKGDEIVGGDRYEVRRVGITPRAELINGRIAMAAITGASIYSFFDGTLLDTILAGRLPEASWFLGG